MTVFGVFVALCVAVASFAFLLKHGDREDSPWWHYVLFAPVAVFAVFGGAAGLIEELASYLFWLLRRVPYWVSTGFNFVFRSDRFRTSKRCRTVGDLRGMLKDLEDDVPLADACGMPTVHCIVEADAKGNDQVRLSPFRT